MLFDAQKKTKRLISNQTRFKEEKKKEFLIRFTNSSFPRRRDGEKIRFVILSIVHMFIRWHSLDFS